MDDQPKKEQSSRVRDQEIRAALDQHWAASDANDFETEHRFADPFPAPAWRAQLVERMDT